MNPVGGQFNLNSNNVAVPNPNATNGYHEFQLTQQDWLNVLMTLSPVDVKSLQEALFRVQLIQNHSNMASLAGAQMIGNLQQLKSEPANNDPPLVVPSGVNQLPLSPSLSHQERGPQGVQMSPRCSSTTASPPTISPTSSTSSATSAASLARQNSNKKHQFLEEQLQQMEEQVVGVEESKLQSISVTTPAGVLSSASSPVGSVSASVSATSGTGGLRPGKTLENGRRKLKDERVSNEEADRRLRRRERNRLAAAKCRKRRQNQIETLQERVDDLKKVEQGLQEEMDSLTREKENLERLMKEHAPKCSLSSSPGVTPGSSGEEDVKPVLIKLAPNGDLTGNSDVLRSGQKRYAAEIEQSHSDPPILLPEEALSDPQPPPKKIRPPISLPHRKQSNPRVVAAALQKQEDAEKAAAAAASSAPSFSQPNPVASPPSTSHDIAVKCSMDSPTSLTSPTRHSLPPLIIRPNSLQIHDSGEEQTPSTAPMSTPRTALSSSRISPLFTPSTLQFLNQQSTPGSAVNLFNSPLILASGTPGSSTPVDISQLYQSLNYFTQMSPGLDVLSLLSSPSGVALLSGFPITSQPQQRLPSNLLISSAQGPLTSMPGSQQMLSFVNAPSCQPTSSTGPVSLSSSSSLPTTSLAATTVSHMSGVESNTISKGGAAPMKIMP